MTLVHFKKTCIYLLSFFLIYNAYKFGVLFMAFEGMGVFRTHILEVVTSGSLHFSVILGSSVEPRDLYLLTAPSCSNCQSRGQACMAEANPQTPHRIGADGISVKSDR